jgi:hypothetical protein
MAIAATVSTAETRVWQASGLRRITLAFAILLLLPFYVSLGPMLFTRLWHGLIVDSLWLALLGACFTVIMALLVIQLVHAIRNRVVLSADKITFTVPSVSGAIAGTRMFSKSVPLADIRAIETREEIYGNALAPMRLMATRVVTREGEAVVLGFTNPENPDQTFPYPKIADDIAQRTGLQVAHHGAVRRNAVNRLLGTTGRNPTDDKVTQEELEGVKVRHGRAMRVIIGGFAALFIAGILIDVFSASRTAFAPLSDDGAPTKKEAPAKKR